ncbi:hypothetical protein [Terriglobus tenax]|uniref:hypothetical protein n=1 Tax=Terriglobus tenax TaxID=1111115 RepID=UPI0021E0D49F|nr:hypothetical protein [Terriglobus tenax]
MQGPERLSQDERREIRRQAQAATGVRLVREDEHGVRCLFCPGTSFRRSKLRTSDLPQVLLLRYPVRCLTCSQRQYASIPVAGLSVPASVRHSRAPRPQETWKSWTDGSGDDPSIVKARTPSYKPYTTVKVAEAQAGKKPAASKPVRKPEQDDAIW